MPCRAALAPHAVRSYRTISPLPLRARKRAAKVGGLLSAALSVGLRRPGVTWHLALWSPDFPRRAYARRDCPADSAAGLYAGLGVCERCDQFGSSLCARLVVGFATRHQSCTLSSRARSAKRVARVRAQRATRDCVMPAPAGPAFDLRSVRLRIEAFTGLRPFAVIARSAATWQSSASRCGQHACRKSKAFTGLRPRQSFHRPAAKAKLSPACGRHSLKAKLSPACGRRGTFHGGKVPKTPCAGRTSSRLLPRRSAARLGNRRPAPNSHFHVFRQRRLSPAAAFDARRAIRRDVALSPHIHVL